MVEPSLERVQKSLIIINAILAVISVICFSFTFVFNCWTFKLKYNFDGQDVKLLLHTILPDDTREYIDQVDWENFGTQKLYLNVGVNTIDSLAAIFSDEKTVVKRLLDRQVDSVIAQARPIASSLLKFMARGLLEVVVRQVANAEGSSSDSIDLSGVENVIDNYLDNKISKDDTINQIVDIAAIEIPKLSGEELSDSDRERVIEYLNSFIVPLEECRDENGKLDMISIIYEKLIEGGVFTNIGSVPTGDEAVSVIKQKVFNRLDSGGVVSVLAIAIKIIALLVLVQAVSWLLLLCFATIRIFVHKKSTGLMFVRTYAWIPHVLLVGIPNALLLLMKAISPVALVNIGLDKLSLSFSSITSVSAGGALIVSVIAIAFYNRLKKQERDYLDDEAIDAEMLYPEKSNPIHLDGQPTEFSAPVEFTSDNNAFSVDNARNEIEDSELSDGDRVK